MNIQRTFEESLQEAKAELRSLDLDRIRSLGISKTHKHLGGSHTVVTYPPLDSLEETDGDEIFRKVKFKPEIDAYVHIPFCEYPCKFCPYTTLNVEGKDGEKVGDYFDALEREVLGWSHKIIAHGSRVRSLYLGGGTPFAIPLRKLEEVIRFLRKTLPFIENPSICVETSPRSTLQEEAVDKLEMLVNLGVNRMSVGVQSFDFDSLRDMARTFPGHTPLDEEAAVRRLLHSGIQNINVDMIQDLPVTNSGLIGRLSHDLQTIARLKPQHVTWYNLRLRPETTYARRNAEIVGEEESLLTRLTIWNFMERIGYVVLEGDRFALAEGYEDQFRQTRGSVETDLLGMGVSAYSHIGGYFFRNSTVIGGQVRADSREATEKYMHSVREKGHAISLSRELTPLEKLAGTFALGLKKGVDLGKVEELRRLSPQAELYARGALYEVDKLVEAGLLEVKDEVLGFTREGRLFENEICRRFYSSEISTSVEERVEDKDYPLWQRAVASLAFSGSAAAAGILLGYAFGGSISTESGFEIPSASQILADPIKYYWTFF